MKESESGSAPYTGPKDYVMTESKNGTVPGTFWPLEGPPYCMRVCIQTPPCRRKPIAQRLLVDTLILTKSLRKKKKKSLRNM